MLVFLLLTEYRCLYLGDRFNINTIQPHRTAYNLLNIINSTILPTLFTLCLSILMIFTSNQTINLQL